MKTAKWQAVVTWLLGAWLLGATTGCSAEKSPPTGASAAKPFQNVGVNDFDRLRAGKNAIVLDVRTPAEFAAGHIPGATNLDWHGSDFEEKVARLDKSKTYLVHCATGRRSALACDRMGSRLGFTNCFNLEGGFRAWEKAGKPTVR